MTQFRIAMGQMRVVGGDLEGNLGRAEAMVRQAGGQGCAAIVLPECLDFGWRHASAREKTMPIPGPISDRIGAWAKRWGMQVVAGLNERVGEKICNSAVMFGGDGQLLRVHRKINELVIGQDYYTVGHDLAAVDTPLGRVGVAICADLSPGCRQVGESLAAMRAQLILSPSAWAVPPDHDPIGAPYGGMWLESYVPLAKRYELTVISVSNVGLLTEGPWAGHSCIGCSLAVGPKGEVLAKGPYGVDAEALLVVEYTPIPRPMTNW